MEKQGTDSIWQVDVGGQIYEASLNELGVWIGEGSLLPQDKVRKGNLRWIEAQKVPGLVPFFNAKTKGESLPVYLTATVAQCNETEKFSDGIEESRQVPAMLSESGANGETQIIYATTDPEHCAVHVEVDSYYVCGSCCSGFCKTCPSSYGGSVKICPLCGAMCKPIVEARLAAQKIAGSSAAVVDGFGIADFHKAIFHPFNFKMSLVVGSLMFALFSIGQSATGMGGIVLFASALICLMLANMLTFGVLANTIDNFVQGKLGSNFMPEFEDFNLWDDMVHPFFLSIAAYLVSFGPFVLALIIAIYLVASSAASEMQTFQSEMERLPGTQYYSGRETVQQSQEVKEVLGDVTDAHQESIDDHISAATGDTNVAPAEPVDEDVEMWNQLQQNRKRDLEATFGKTAETREKEFSGMVSGILKLAAPFVIAGSLAFLWGVFFYPAACAVAGYTRSFTATINPFVGLDTIRRMGPDYLKILFMCLVLAICSLFAGAILSMILAPFDLPGMGNIPAKFLSSLITFYLFTVFSCIIGYALYKNAHKLGLVR